MIRKVAIVTVFALVVLQFFPSSRNLNSDLVASDISIVKHVPSDVMELLHVACYDCHSNNTRYPWYASVQPLGWWINRHVAQGKHHLNFSDFGKYSIKKSNHKLDEIAEIVGEGEMPLGSYSLMHASARLNSNQRQLLINWAKQAQ